MKGDLISRRALLEKLNNSDVNIEFELPVEEVLGEEVDIDDFTMLLQEAIQIYREMLIRTITEQPTAYSVEKVVAELEEWSFEAEILIPTSDGYEDTATREIICTKNVIDIVRNGGKE